MTAITRIAAPSHYANRHEATANGFDRGSSPSHVMRQASHAATSPRKAASSATAASTDSYPHGLLAQTTQWRFPPAKAALSQTFGGLGRRQCCGKFGLQGKWLPGSVAESALRDVWQIQLLSVMTRKRREIRARRAGVEPTLAECWASSESLSKADLARRTGVSRARITQVTRAAVASAS